MDYLAHPFKTARYLATTAVNVDFEKQRAIVVEGTLDDEVVYTSSEDVANVVTRAIDYEGEWPVVGGISGNRITVRELLQIGENIRGKCSLQEW